ncbi:hypothetical protein BAUCODRAFT_122436 [Baudoinia panamericana UAMH 10762]|uniref:Carboxymuconolactone decarboxylase-like domain-containing protein n=1 Tax=Baudoinia panamericana (strain UAMH 10762) TaxID=717646 RepID=M2LPV3_BAUPA|nr:uncharacterized protein BAUCODRAFT_122436 [Baudoinia panamericana UAMH 10762]EMC96432.1 hypothetical protein BAUCODRAFT_122436 [Baudoinia panamericana UAMH 10762]
MSDKFSAEEIKKAHEVLYNEGIKMRYQVAGKEYVDKALNAADNDFARPMQQYVSEACWGWVWSRPGLELKTRSLLNLAMLCALNRSTELAVHTRGALVNGATEEEIRETILQAACYCGMPAGMEGFKVTGRVIEEWKKEQPAKAHNVEPHADVGLEQRAKGDE